MELTCPALPRVLGPFRGSDSNFAMIEAQSSVDLSDWQAAQLALLSMEDNRDGTLTLRYRTAEALGGAGALAEQFYRVSVLME